MEIAMLQTNKAAAEQATTIDLPVSDSQVRSRPRLVETAKPEETEKTLSAEKLKERVRETTDSLNEMSSLLKYGIRFAYDDKVSEMLVNVIEKDTNRVIRQIPSKEILAMRAKMAEMVGLLVDQEA
ncbi:MAG: flagellar protein FlaG [Deltaproteobacteria bacterium]|nr:flagellar protein FlaG [Deltaproteobacteria bacterium]